jgi:glucokinase
LSARDASAIGIDVGGTQIRAAHVSAAGDVLAWNAQPTATDPLAVIAQLRALVRDLDGPGVAAIGIGVPGRVDARHGRILSGGYVDLSGHSLAEGLGNPSDRPVFVDNDGNMALAGEHAAGSARAASTAVMFTIGTGIGGGVIADGALLRGKNAAGQLGHIAIDRNGENCICGRRGCVETMSSGTALRRHIAAAGLPDGTSAENLLDRAAVGDEIARDVIAAWAAPMRVAIDTMVAAFDPDVIVLGGGLGRAMHRALAEFPAEARWYQCTVVPATLGDRAGVIGAGLSALARRNESVGAPR